MFTGFIVGLLVGSVATVMFVAFMAHIRPAKVIKALVPRATITVTRKLLKLVRLDSDSKGGDAL